LLLASESTEFGSIPLPQCDHSIPSSKVATFKLDDVVAQMTGRLQLPAGGITIQFIRA